MRDRFIDCHADQIDLCGYRCGFTHLDLAGTAAAVFPGNRRSCIVIDQYEVFDVDKGAENSHLHIQIAFGVRQCVNGSLKIH